MKIRKIIQTAAVTLVMAFAFALPVVTTDGPVASAAAPASVTQGVKDATPSGAGTVPLATLIKNIVNILLFVVGVASVIIIIIGGLRYVTSAGDSSQISGAKNTILYAVVGLVVATMAFAIVNFVTSKL